MFFFPIVVNESLLNDDADQKMKIICFFQDLCSSSEGASGEKQTSSKKVNEALNDLMAAVKDEVLGSNKELMSKMQEEMECLAKYNEELQSQLSKHEEDNIKLKEESVKEHEKFKAELGKMTHSNQELRIQVEGISKFNEELKSKLAESRKEYDAMSATLKCTIDEKADITRRISEMEKDHNEIYVRLKSKIKQKHTLQRSLDTATSKLALMAREKGTLTQHNEKLKGDINILQDSRITVSAKLNHVLKENQAIVQCNEKLLHDSNVLKSERDTVSVKLKQMTAKLKQVTDETEATYDKNKELKFKMAIMSKEHDDLSTTLDNIRENCNNTSERLANETLKLKRVTEEKAATWKDNEELKRKMATMKDDHDHLTTTLEKFREKCNNSLELLANETVKLHHMTKEKEAMSESNEELKLKITTMREEYDDLSKTLEKIRENCNNTSELLANEKDTTKRLEKAVADKQFALDHETKLKDKFREESEALKREKYQLKISLDASECRVEQRQKSELEKDRKIVNLEKQINSLKKKSEEKAEAAECYNAMNAKMSNVKQENENLSRRNKDLTSELARLRQKLGAAEAQSQLTKEHDKIGNLKEEIAHMTQYNEELKMQVSDLRYNLQNSLEPQNDTRESKSALTELTASSRDVDVKLRDHDLRLRLASKTSRDDSRDLRDLMRSQRIYPAHDSNMNAEDTEDFEFCQQNLGPKRKMCHTHTMTSTSPNSHSSRSSYYTQTDTGRRGRARGIKRSRVSL